MKLHQPPTLWGKIHAAVQIQLDRLYRNKTIRTRCDYVILSYEKSGRTWLRSLLGKYFELLLQVEFTTEFNNNSKLPRIKFTHDAHILKHANKVVVLTRKSPDVLVSHYYHQTYRDRIFKGTISEFLRSNQGVSRLKRYFNILKYYEDRPHRFLHITYEKLHYDGFKTFEKVLKFLNIEIDKQKIKKTFEFCEFKNMKKLSETGKLGFRYAPTDKKDIRTHKVRKGIVDGHKKELSKEDIAYVKEQLGDIV